MGQDLENRDLRADSVKALLTKNGNGKKAKKCTQCDYTPSGADQMNRHLKTHSGEKSNKCSKCNYASSLASSLTKHLKIHSGEKPFFLISLEAHQTYSVSLKTIGGQDYRDLDAQ